MQQSMDYGSMFWSDKQVSEKKSYLCGTKHLQRVYQLPSSADKYLYGAAKMGKMKHDLSTHNWKRWGSSSTDKKFLNQWNKTTYQMKFLVILSMKRPWDPGIHKFS